ncbi:MULTISPECIES: cold-shock protein [Pseudomonas]|nr:MULTISPECIES: cold shock domain-containing protein [Pseudomonas]MBJ2246951.1 cold-shock protein [Pseudomonas haemolytica]MBJ2272812.1 cold-shock protein [Pseudomonas haemolytica]MBJ2282989.1 cold-shock protein [Pseudomonas sp. MF6755]MBK3447122.1 cold-shock protein [Pseudomonas haemolytica]MBK3458618.1 cold-shock protein [Pseudomonas haemolytica]
MEKGTVRVFNKENQFAEIQPDEGEGRVTAYEEALSTAKLTDLQEGDRVIYEVRSDGHVSHIRLVRS